MASTAPYYEQPEVPWCILGKVTWGVVTAVKVPEDKAAYYVHMHGFHILIRDSDFPVAIDDRGTMPDVLKHGAMQSHPRRHVYRVDMDVYPEGDLDA